jgi:hypothetical protein
MKNLIIVLVILFGMAACKSGDKKAAVASKSSDSPAFNSVDNPTAHTEGANAVDTSNFTAIQWIDKINQSLPKIKEGEVIEVTYRFKNIGSKPLIVQNVSASCGCTVPEKPEQPILPGMEGLIKAKFDSHGKTGSNTKTLTVLANTNSDKVLTFSVEVEK